MSEMGNLHTIIQNVDDIIGYYDEKGTENWKVADYWSDDLPAAAERIENMDDYEMELVKVLEKAEKQLSTAMKIMKKTLKAEKEVDDYMDSQGIVSWEDWRSK